MSVPLRVLGDRVLVKPDRDPNAPETLESGIVVAKSLAAAVTGEDATTSVHRGTVLAVGNPKHPLDHEASSLARVIESRARATGYDDTPEIDAAQMLRDLVRRQPSVSVDDDVLFSHDAGQQITMDGETYVILHEAELLAVVEP
jgi:co-chaperonin GroES (HSP10)